MHEMIPIGLLNSGQLGVVENVLGLPDQVHRLEELGLRGGVEIEMVQPGSPCIIRLSGHKLCFRADDMMTVLVRPRASA